MIEQNQITSGEFQLTYKVFGEGNQTVICLHGHGRSADDFLFLEDRNVKVISINLFLHDESFFPLDRIDNDPVAWEEIFPVFQKLFAKENVDRFHIFAFSQGGRFALLLLESLPEYIQTFTLLAPDGLDNNSFYNWSSRRKYFRNLFKRWLEKPQKLQKAADISSKLKLMRPKVRDFVYKFSSDRETMERASQTWMAFRNLQPDPETIGKMVRKYQIPFLIIMGKYDQIIRPKVALKFLKHAGLPEEIVEIENGHDFFKASAILRYLEYLPFLKPIDGIN